MYRGPKYNSEDTIVAPTPKLTFSSLNEGPNNSPFPDAEKKEEVVAETDDEKKKEDAVEVVDTENKDSNALLDNQSGKDSNKDSKVDDKGKTTEVEAGSFDSVKDSVAKLAGRDIDEDYLKTDYRGMYQEVSEKLDKFKSVFGDNLEIPKWIEEAASYAQKGGDVSTFFKNQLIDPATMSEEDKIRFLLNQELKDSKQKDDLVNYRMSKDYGFDLTDEELSDLKEENPDAYFDIISKRESSLKNADKALLEFKEANKIPENWKAPEPDMSEEDIIKNQEILVNDLKDIVKNFSEFTVEVDGSELKIPIDAKEALAPIFEKIVSEDVENGLIAVTGVSKEKLVKALWLLENNGLQIEAIAQHNKVKAESDADKAYNHSGGAGDRVEQAKTISAENLTAQIRSQLAGSN